jgi:hypothetical protein
MYQYIEQLRNKPDHHKRRVALLASGAITGLIFFAWLSVILPSNTSQIVADSSQSQGVSEADNNTPIETLKRSTAQVFDAIKVLFQKTATSASNVNLEDNYTKMKTQVETGQIKLVPSPDSSQ